MTPAFELNGATPVIGPRFATHRSVGILGFLVTGYVALLPYLFEVGKRMNFAPADCFLLLALLLARNAYGGFLVVALVICEGASWGPAPLFKGPTFWITRITLALGILFTFSRSAWMGLALALLLLAVVRPTLIVRPVLVVLTGA